MRERTGWPKSCQCRVNPVDLHLNQVLRTLWVAADCEFASPSARRSVMRQQLSCFSPIIAAGFLLLAFFQPGEGLTQQRSAQLSVDELFRKAGISKGNQGKAPDFTLREVNGNSVSLSGYRGNLVFLNFWATWCGPCRQEMPSMERLHRRFAGTDLRVVAVSVDQSDEQLVDDYIKEQGYTFDVLHDPSTEIQRIYQTTGIPESFVIDRNGVIVKKEIGARHWDAPATETLIQRLLDGR